MRDWKNGFLFPKYTTAEKILLPNVIKGCVIFDIDNDQLEEYNGSSWSAFGVTVTAAGNSTNIQFNNLGSFSGSDSLVWDFDTSIMTVLGSVGIGRIATTYFDVFNTKTNVIMIESSKANGDAGLKVKNDAKQWQLYVNGANYDNLCVRDDDLEIIRFSIKAGTAGAKGNVGINIDNPTSTLHISENIDINNIVTISSSGIGSSNLIVDNGGGSLLSLVKGTVSTLFQGIDLSNYGILYNAGSKGILIINDGTGDDTTRIAGNSWTSTNPERAICVDTTTGRAVRLGVNIAAPTAELQVVGSSIMDGTLTVNSDLTVFSATLDISETIQTNKVDGIAKLMIKNDTREWVLRNNGANSDFFDIYDDTANKSRLIINNTGLLAIGENNPSTSLLQTYVCQVQGNLYSSGIISSNDTIALISGNIETVNDTYFYLNKAGADSTLYISNTVGSYKASLNVENKITAYSMDIVSPSPELILKDNNSAASISSSILFKNNIDTDIGKIIMTGNSLSIINNEVSNADIWLYGKDFLSGTFARIDLVNNDLAFTGSLSYNGVESIVGYCGAFIEKHQQETNDGKYDFKIHSNFSITSTYLDNQFIYMTEDGTSTGKSVNAYYVHKYKQPFREWYPNAGGDDHAIYAGTGTYDYFHFVLPKTPKNGQYITIHSTREYYGANTVKDLNAELSDSIWVGWENLSTLGTTRLISNKRHSATIMYVPYVLFADIDVNNYFKVGDYVHISFTESGLKEVYGVVVELGADADIDKIFIYITDATSEVNGHYYEYSYDTYDTFRSFGTVGDYTTYSQAVGLTCRVLRNQNMTIVPSTSSTSIQPMDTTHIPRLIFGDKVYSSNPTNYNLSFQYLTLYNGVSVTLQYREHSQVLETMGLVGTLTGTTTSTSNTVTVTSTANIQVGYRVKGIGIQVDTFVISLITDTSFVMSNPATASGSITITSYQNYAGWYLTNSDSFVNNSIILSNIAPSIVLS
jgi:hypothetical protein